MVRSCAILRKRGACLPPPLVAEDEKRAELAALAERETAQRDWLPATLRLVFQILSACGRRGGRASFCLRPRRSLPRGLGNQQVVAKTTLARRSIRMHWI